MSKIITVTQFNRGIAINNTFVNEDGTVKDITGYTSNVDVIYPDNTKENIQLEVINAVSGQVLFTLGTLQTTQIGTHELYFNLTDSNSFITAQNVIRYVVIAENGGV